MKEILKKHHISFSHAVEGIVWAFTNHPNFRIHFGISLIVLLEGYFFSISTVELLLLVFCIVLGFATEMANTALECVVDLVTKEWRVDAKHAKDVAAGMMLVVAIGTSIIAAIIFIPHIISFNQ